MRNLTVKRQKAYAGSLGTMKLYVEDPLSTELTINGTPCRKLGTLKNGEEKTFSIEDHSMKLFVIADTLSKDAYNEVYTVPAGTEDIYLSGKNHFNPMAGNPFRFENVNSEETLKNRKKTGKKMLVIMICAIAVGLVLGFAFGMSGGDSNDPKTFTADGFQITLTEEFSDFEEEGCVACYASEDVVIRVSKETFASYPILAECTLEDYALLILESSELDSELSEIQGLLSCEVEQPGIDGKTMYNIFITFYKSNTAFWVVETAAQVQDAQAVRADAINWAKSIQITD